MLNYQLLAHTHTHTHTHTHKSTKTRISEQKLKMRIKTSKGEKVAYSLICVFGLLPGRLCAF